MEEEIIEHNCRTFNISIIFKLLYYSVIMIICVACCDNTAEETLVCSVVMEMPPSKVNCRNR